MGRWNEEPTYETLFSKEGLWWRATLCGWAGTAVLESCVDLPTSCKPPNSLGETDRSASRGDDTDWPQHVQKVQKLCALPLGTEEADSQTHTEKETYQWMNLAVNYVRTQPTEVVWTMMMGSLKPGYKDLSQAPGSCALLAICLRVITWRQTHRSPNCLQNSFQKLEMNCGPRLDRISLGKPCRRTTLCRTASAVSLAEGNLGMATKWTILENLLTIVRMVVLPSERGSPVTKSREMSDQGRLGTGRGWSNPWGSFWEVLQQDQTGQAATKSWMSLISGHQKHWPTKNWVRRAPGWQARWEEWPHWTTWERNSVGTKRRLGGRPLGTGPEQLADWTQKTQTGGDKHTHTRKKEKTGRNEEKTYRALTVQASLCHSGPSLVLDPQQFWTKDRPSVSVAGR